MGSGRNPWPVTATTAATPTGIVFLVGGAVEVPSPSLFPASRVKIQFLLEWAATTPRRCALPEGAALGAGGVCAVSCPATDGGCLDDVPSSAPDVYVRPGVLALVVVELLWC